MKRWMGSLILFLADFVSKRAALLWIPAQGISLFKTEPLSFSLDLAFNTGAAWGLFANYGEILFIVRSLVVLGLFWFLIQTRKAATSLYFLLGSALGNMADTLFYGYVIDFLHFRFWNYSFPIFNLADTGITLSLAYLFLFQKKEESRASHRISS